ncbi:MAG: hypothetical protein JSS31_10630 [Proteobacteria bacterium]|nr:hypothetical protein [Pseudomonadota bacterium]
MPLPTTARTAAYCRGLPWLLAGGLQCQAMAQTGLSHPAMASVEISVRAAPMDTPGQPMRLSVTRWMAPGYAGSFGFSLGMELPAQGYRQPYTPPVTRWNPELGVRWRMPLGSDRHLDMGVWAHTGRTGQQFDAMGMILDREQSRFGTNLEVQWNSSRTGGLMPEFGAIGVQLEGNSRLLLRAKRGGPMLYYRTRF